MLANCLVSLSSQRQNIVAQSLIKIEYIATLKAIKKTVLIGRLLKKLCKLEIYLIFLHYNN